MSITIRLTKLGKKNAPTFRIVVANTKDKRNGRYLDKIGYFNPSVNPAALDIDKEKYQDWVSKGALVTDSVKELVAGTYTFKPYKSKADKTKNA